MTASTRQEAVRRISTQPTRTETAVAQEASGSRLPELFGSLVFNDQVQRQRLSRTVYQALRSTIEAGTELDPAIADAVAAAMKDWAIEHGATHYTHWFQPMTGFTAEKHDSFLTPTSDGRAILEFSGSQLVKGEPDASSFPSGGLRATFEARGYTAWDPTSPAFLRKSSGGSTLTIPTAFCSWNGEALDKKTPLLRSCEAVSGAAVRLLNLIGESKITRVQPTAGVEQEYFLIDRRFFHLRPDLVSAGRTLFGARPHKGQECEDHYFGNISRRVLEFMMELEEECWMLGIPIKTRHNEVAPSQFELAPVYQAISVSCDQNMLIMSVIDEIAARHDMKALLHEKPFDNMNGSGKHLNWSLADNLGNNVLEPGHTPHENLKFILFLTAIVTSIDRHQDLLRASIASAGNDHRLGANEAPPAIMSVFVGSRLEEIIDSIVEGRAPRTREGAASALRLGVSALPDLPRDHSDRNRTSPFAFTGNKFEFRAVSSNQSIAYPAAFLNLIVAEALDDLASAIEERGGPSTENVQAAVRDFLERHRRILFAGDNYTPEWSAEAEKRGLENRRSTPDALSVFASDDNVALYERYGVLSRSEAESRFQVQNELFIKKVNIEAIATRDIAMTMILPAAIRYQQQLAESIRTVREIVPDADLEAEREVLSHLTATLGRLKKAIDALLHIQEDIENARMEIGAHAQAYHDRIRPAMDAVRAEADLLERLVDDQLWPLPKYREMLFIH